MKEQEHVGKKFTRDSKKVSVVLKRTSGEAKKRSSQHLLSYTERSQKEQDASLVIQQDSGEKPREPAFFAPDGQLVSKVKRKKESIKKQKSELSIPTVISFSSLPPAIKSKADNEASPKTPEVLNRHAPTAV